MVLSKPWDGAALGKSAEAAAVPVLKSEVDNLLAWVQASLLLEGALPGKEYFLVVAGLVPALQSAIDASLGKLLPPAP